MFKLFYIANLLVQTKKFKTNPRNCVYNLSMNENELKESQFDRPFRIHKSFAGSVAWLLLFEIITKL